MPALRGAIADVLDDVIADHHVELAIRERQLNVADLGESIPVVDLPAVVDVDGIDLETPAGVRAEVVGYAAGTGTDFQQAHRVSGRSQAQ